MLPNSSAKVISSILKLKLWTLRPEKLNLCEEAESEDKAAAHPEPAFYGTVVDVVFYGTIDKVFVRLDNSNQTVVAYQYLTTSNAGRPTNASASDGTKETR